MVLVKRLTRGPIGLFLATVFLLAACAKKVLPLETSSQLKTLDASCAISLDGGNSCLSILWEQAPSETEYVSFLFFVVPKANPAVIQNYISEAQKIELKMPSMHHGSAKIEVTKISENVYRASNVSVYMHGDWVLEFTFKDSKANSRFETYAFNF